MSDTLYNKENFLQHLEMLKPNGYTLDNKGFYYKQDSNNRIEIQFSFDEDFPFDVTFYGISVGICFTEVEQIFHQVWQGFPNLDFGHSLTATTFNKGFREDIIGESGYDFLYDNPVSDTASFNEVYPYLNQLMNAAVNFVNQYPTLQSLFTYAETMPIQEQAKFYNQPLPARKMIILKLLNNSNYTSYATDVVNHYNQQPDAEEAAFLQALKNYLDTL
ncbi:hypothetical protein EG240_01595 [Paenimyroides tangerinum]|uniref:DUF4304 domain-containing protein n=1 Tax=Paenimyroides tangerinum TaxID=2488728 RepID=A0A3P3WED3_9FLAO|nr:hypothetical protein [Paenimyroides tangerinum]RRJ92737.1 hypothetical protein EG240_01595 [Paenimyroides tangerinum]